MKYIKCRKCQKTYEERPFDKHSIIPDNYLKANLGFCSEKCFKTLSKAHQAHEKMILALHGTVRKDNSLQVS